MERGEDEPTACYFLPSHRLLKQSLMKNTKTITHDAINESIRISDTIEISQTPLELHAYSNRQSSQDRHLLYSKQSPFLHERQSSQLVHVEQIPHFLQRPSVIYAPSIQLRQLVLALQSRHPSSQATQSESVCEKKNPVSHEVHPIPSSQVLHQLWQYSHLLSLRYLLLTQLKQLSLQQVMHPLGHALHLQSVRQYRLVQEKQLSPEHSRQPLEQGLHSPSDTPY